MIKVLIVEDSPVMQQQLIYTISSDPDFRVVGVANDGEEAIEAAAKLHPDVITMDWHMPKLNGQEATRIIMETNPTPIVIVTSSMAANDVMHSFSVVEAGALALVRKPCSIEHPDYEKEARELNKTLKLMSEVKLVRRISLTKKKIVPDKSTYISTIKKESDIQVVAIGASTGGPQVLNTIISGLPKNFPVPLLIVQHISHGFVGGFIEWLSKSTGFPLHVAAPGEYILPGHGYIAPDDFHMGVDKYKRIALSTHDLENGMRPSVSYLFRTTAEVYGANAAGVLLTGMGRDGADELKLMKDKGAVTIAQDEASSVVHGMPGEAIKLNAATYVLSPEEITAALIELINKNKGDSL